MSICLLGHICHRSDDEPSVLLGNRDRCAGGQPGQRRDLALFRFGLRSCLPSVRVFTPQSKLARLSRPAKQSERPDIFPCDDNRPIPRGEFIRHRCSSHSARTGEKPPSGPSNGRTWQGCQPHSCTTFAIQAAFNFNEQRFAWVFRNARAQTVAHNQRISIPSGVCLRHQCELQDLPQLRPQLDGEFVLARRALGPAPMSHC